MNRLTEALRNCEAPLLQRGAEREGQYTYIHHLLYTERLRLQLP